MVTKIVVVQKESLFNPKNANDYKIYSRAEWMCVVSHMSRAKQLAEKVVGNGVRQLVAGLWMSQSERYITSEPIRFLSTFRVASLRENRKLKNILFSRWR
jgi:hypothetical protein